ncbi:Carrier domain-containing protein OS=Streptomyces fumanus OX=67302 GN=GCM10018772_39350 PE=4 SV=1 [Streptomyces fumanus]
MHSGVGFALPYIGLARRLTAGHPVYGLASRPCPARPNRPSAWANWPATTSPGSRRIQPEGPYHLFGWSFGGLWCRNWRLRAAETGGRPGGRPGRLPQHGRAAEQRSESEMLVNVLEVIGHDRSRFDGRVLTPDDVLDVLRADDHPLLALGEDTVRRIMALSHRHGALLREFAPRPYDGELHLVAATADRDDAQQAALADRWRPYVGRLTQHTVDVGHEYLMHPAPQAWLAAVINRLLKDGAA